MWLLLPLLLSTLAWVEGQPGWVFPGEKNNNKKDNSIDQATAWVNEVLKNTDNNLKNRFQINISNSGKSNLSCTTPDGKDGQCVRPQYCVEELPETDPSTLFTYRESLSSCHYLLQCCALNQIKEVPKKTNTLPSSCGWSNPGGYRLRTLDTDSTGFSDYGDFPWMVALLKKPHNPAWTKEDYIGGGTLIHPSVVLTVAHSINTKKPDELICRVGEWDTMAENEIYPHQDRDVRKIAIHNEFLKLRAHYDAALLFLVSPYNLKNVYHIGVACLARDMPTPGTLCYSMGWGSSFNDTKYATLLKKIRLPWVESEKCQNQLRRTRLGPKYALHNSLTCAGGEAGKDTCVGDGGSPLVCAVEDDNVSTRYAVYGMVAYGVGCGVKDVPGVYAKVPAMIDWINQEMEGEQLDTTTYVA